MVGPLLVRLIGYPEALIRTAPPWVCLAVPMLVCLLCGKSSSLYRFDPRGFEDDIFVQNLQGLGRGRGFKVKKATSILSRYPYKGAFLVRTKEKSLPVYYLVYTTNNKVAAKIMRDIMKKEGNYSLYTNLLTGKPQTLDQVYPLERFIFD